MTNEDMKLPDNKTCGDCAHLFRCIKLFGAQLTNMECDFFPIKFVSNIMTTAQEPVGWMDSEGRFRLDFKTEIVRSISAVNKEIPLYTHPAPSWQGNKEFVGLSDDEIYRIYSEVQDNCVKDFPPELYVAWFKNTKEKNT